MTALEYHKYSEEAAREAEKAFITERETVEEAIRIEKSKIIVLTKRMHKIKDVESFDFAETVRMIRKAEKRIDELNKEQATILVKENQLYNEVLERMASEAGEEK